VRSHDITPRPFLKWAGGKGQLLNDLIGRIHQARPFGRYHEPFVGGGALFFELMRTRKIEGSAYLSDSNPHLIAAYIGVRDHVEEVVALLEKHAGRHCRDHYYSVRAQAPLDRPAQAARIIYLNRTCYNGLYRENSKGLFNVPIGRYVNPMICDSENLRAASTALQAARLDVRAFESVLDVAESGDLVYFDPPYHPISKTSSFTGYHKNGFGEQDQRKLAAVFAALDRKSVKVLLSNSKTDFVEKLYAGFRIEEVYATRSVNSRADRRGKISEALVRNF
jgi:DNA adenine methylase